MSANPWSGCGKEGGLHYCSQCGYYVDDSDQSPASVDLATAQKRIEELEAALRRTLSRCTNCDTCGPALCPECEIDVAVLGKVKP